MTDELARLIEEQRKDDASTTIWPQVPPNHVSVPLDKAMEMSGTGSGGLPCIAGDFLVGETYDFEEMIDSGDYEAPGEICHAFIRPGSVSSLISIPHGTENGYTNLGCRCKRCTEANTVATSRRKSKRLVRKTPDHVHGSTNGYDNYNCRCHPCTQAKVAYRQEQKLRGIGCYKPLTTEQRERKASLQRQRRASLTSEQREARRVYDRERKRVERARKRAA